MDILDILLDILLKPPQPFIGLFFQLPIMGYGNTGPCLWFWLMFCFSFFRIITSRSGGGLNRSSSCGPFPLPPRRRRFLRCRLRKIKKCYRCCSCCPCCPQQRVTSIQHLLLSLMLCRQFLPPWPMCILLACAHSVFRWFKFTLKPPYSIALDNL